MENELVDTDSLKLHHRTTERWEVLRIVGLGEPQDVDVEAMAKVLKPLAAESKKGLCIHIENILRPKSSLLSVLVGLLASPDNELRKIALVKPPGAWLDMLDILGVTSGFRVVESVEEVTLED